MSGSLAWRKSGCPAFAASQKADARVSSPFIWNLEVRIMERTGLCTCVLQPAKRMHSFWSGMVHVYPCLVFATAAFCCYLTETSKQARKKNHAYLPKKLLLDKWKTKNWIEVRKTCCEEKYLAPKNHPNWWSATWSKINESRYEYRYPSYLICETRAYIPAPVWDIKDIKALNAKSVGICLKFNYS